MKGSVGKMQRGGSNQDDRPPSPQDAGSARIAEDDNQEIIPGSEATAHVMLGRGARSIGNQGNVVFRTIVQTRKAEYCATNNRKTKDVIARQVMNAVYQRNAKFVRKQSPDSDQDDSWIVVTDEASILRKIKQSLRDRDPGEGRTARGEPRRETRPQVASRVNREPPPAVASRPSSRSEASSPSSADRRRPPKKRRQQNSQGEIINTSSSTNGNNRDSSDSSSYAMANQEPAQRSMQVAGLRQPFPGQGPLQRIEQQQRSAGSVTANSFPDTPFPPAFLGALRFQQQQAAVGSLVGGQQPGQQHQFALSPLAQLLATQDPQQATIPPNRFGHSANQQFAPNGASFMLGQQHQPSLPGDSILNQQQQHLLAASRRPGYNLSTLRRLNTSTSLNAAAPVSSSSGSHHDLSSDGDLFAVHHHSAREQHQRQNSWQQPEEHKHPTREELVLQHQQRRMEHSHEETQQELSAEDRLILEILQRRRRLESFFSQQNQGAAFGQRHPMPALQSNNNSAPASDFLALQMFQQRQQLQGLLAGQQQQQDFYQLLQQQQPPNQLLLSAEQQARGLEAPVANNNASAPRGTSTESSPPEDKKPKARED